jgi:hypothetical protein
MFAVEDDASHAHLDQTNAITAVGDKANFDDGHVRIAQTGENAFYVVVSVEAGQDDTAYSRYVLKRIAGGFKA